MPEIMSAEELCLMVQGYNHDSVECVMPSSYVAIQNIRSRDSAMLEKYKEVIASIPFNFASSDDCKVMAMDALDSAFAEIEGGK